MKPPLYPPASWFEHPGDIPTDRRITITDEGRVYGYVALRGACHAGMPGCVQPPMESPSNFEYAHQGETKLEDGSIISTANIGGGAGHADMNASVSQAADFYANTQTQLMRVRYGTDESGLWFSGSLWPDVDEITIERIRASALSGDWRFMGQWRKAGAKHEFVGTAMVNIPGYHMANGGEAVGETGVPVPIAASGAAVIEPSGNFVVTYTSDNGTNGEGDMSCTCKDKAAEENVTADASTCPCGEKPASECSGECEKNVTAEATPEEPAAEVETPAEAEPKLVNETSNDIISSLGNKVDDLGARMVGIEEMLMQMYADKLLNKLEE